MPIGIDAFHDATHSACQYRLDWTSQNFLCDFTVGTNAASADAIVVVVVVAADWFSAFDDDDDVIADDDDDDDVAKHTQSKLFIK